MKAKSSMVSLNNETDECMTKLCRESSAGLSRVHVYDMLDIWRKYESMDRGIGTTIPKKYLSRRTSFYEVVQQLIGSKASYIQQLAKAGSLLMYPGDQSDFLISRTLTKSTQSDMLTSDCLWNFQQTKVASKACRVRYCPASSYSLRGAR